MRVTQRQMYGGMVDRMNNTLSALMESNIQSSSQKRINKPSDDPVGMTRVLNYRTSLENTAQYQRNVSTAEAWLNLADNTIITMGTQIARCMELAGKAASGPMTDENRDEVSSELRQIFEQLIQMANSKIEDNYIFAGHRTNEPPFREVLTAMSHDAGMQGVQYAVQGNSKSTMVVQFLEDGEIGAQDLQYRYSADGGHTWTTATLSAVPGWPTPDRTVSMVMGGVTVEMKIPEPTPPATGTMVQKVNPDKKNEKDNGTWLYVRPSAAYNGDDVDGLEIRNYGGGDTKVDAKGYFTANVSVRVDNGPVDLAAGGSVEYSYSLDGGRNWVSGNKTDVEAGGTTRLPVPGGFVELTPSADPGASTVLPQDAQFIVKPHRASVDIEISNGETIAINTVGKDVFGGLYQGTGEEYPQAVFGGDSRNMFEVLGRLIAYTENNNQDGASQSLEELRELDVYIQTQVASVGGRENRLSVTKFLLQTTEDTETQGLSSVEDVDLFELTTRMAQQQLALQCVLRSSSMMMQLSLMNFI